jgi:UDP-N-acetylmuramoyl-tripeptide--D-alanyl-D-alanine ligase
VIPLTLAEVAAATGGRLVDADPATVATGLVLDSRLVQAGDLFAGLPGEHADGATFAAAAVAAGAAAALVPEGAAPGLARVEVADPAAAMAAIGSALRARSGARVVGVTGSSGKTITKDLLAAVLGTRLRVVASERSFNNELGLPLTLARLAPETQALVVELGARGIGHIATLCAQARPHVGVVTNVGLAHIGMFGSRQAIATAKGELIEALPGDGAAVLNADDELVMAMAARTAAKVVSYGIAGQADVRALEPASDADARASFTLVTPNGRARVHLPAPGGHLVLDALAAAAAAWFMGLAVEDIAAGLEAAPLSPMRMQLRRRPDGVRVIDDSYNANPASMAAGLRTLVAARGGGARAVAVLGEMAELGTVAEAEHEAIGRLAAQLGVDRLVAVGSLGALTAKAAGAAGLAETVAVDRVEDAGAAVGPLEPGDVVLVKASRAVGLDRAVGALLGTDPNGEGAA